MGRISGRRLRRGVLLLLLVGGGLLLAACSRVPGQPGGRPIAAFDATPTSGTAPLDVTFTDTSTGNVATHQWDFGDNTGSTDQSATHTYGGGGTYTVTLTVTGPGNSSSTASKTLTVNAPPTVSITAPQDGTISAPDFPVTFTGTATDSEDGDLGASIEWHSRASTAGSVPARRSRRRR